MLSGFPVLVYLSVSSGIGSTDVSAVFDELTSDANRKKIAITTSDGTTQCYVEIERWDDANEKAWLWVKVPSVASGAETDLYLYYDFDPTPKVRISASSPQRSLLMKNISTFKFKGAGRTIRFKICKEENIGEDFNITACKEKAVF